MTAPHPPFSPPRGLRSAFLQSYMASFRLRRRLNSRRHPGLDRASQRHVVDAGQGVRLEAHISLQQGEPLGRVILLHGWEGSHDSIYLHSLGCHLHAHGFAVGRLNLRDHGGTHALNKEPFHSARMDEVFGGLAAVNSLLGEAPFSLVGFSLGGNFTLRAALGAPQQGLPMQQAIAVNPVMDPLKTAEALDRSVLYRRYFHDKWLKTVNARVQAWPEGPDYADLKDSSSFVEISRRFVTRYCGFDSLEDYFAEYTLTPDFLAELRTPSLIVSARDDALVPVEDAEALAEHPAVDLLLPERGGHCGYVENLRLESWLEPVLRHRLESGLPRGAAAA